MTFWGNFTPARKIWGLLAP